MNQHDHKYSIIQHTVTHADKLWQILDRKKIHLELKKEKNKIQQCYKNFDQHHHNNLRSQDQSGKQQSSHQSFHQNSQQDFQQESCDTQQSFRQNQNRLKLSLFINKHNYHKENNFYFKCSFSNHSIRDCKFFFNLNQIFVKNDKIKSQFYKMWARKHTRIQILHINNSSNNDKNDHNVHIITDEDYKFNFDKSCKYLKN